MAYWFIEGHDPGGSKQFQYYMDTDSDVNNLPTSTSNGAEQESDSTVHLPCGKGSAALSIESGKLFTLNSNNQWVQLGGD